jgi:hypothetical protein
MSSAREEEGRASHYASNRRNSVREILVTIAENFRLGHRP